VEFSPGKTGFTLPDSQVWPTVIPVRDEKMQELCAFMCMASELDEQRELDLFRDFKKKKEIIPYKSPAPFRFRPMRYPLRDLEEVIEKSR
jgi:hypothetical protein